MPARDRADWTFLQTALRTAALEGVALAGGVAHGVAGARCALLTAADDMGPDIGQGRAATHHYTTAQAADTKTTEPVAWARAGLSSVYPPPSSRCLYQAGDTLPVFCPVFFT